MGCESQRSISEVSVSFSCGNADGYDGCDPSTLTATDNGVYIYQGSGPVDRPEQLLVRCGGVSHAYRSGYSSVIQTFSIGGQEGSLSADGPIADQKAVQFHYPGKIIKASASLSAASATGAVVVEYEFFDADGNEWPPPSGPGSYVPGPDEFSIQENIHYLEISRLQNLAVPVGIMFRERVDSPGVGAANLTIMVTVETYVKDPPDCPGLTCGSVVPLCQAYVLQKYLGGSPLSVDEEYFFMQSNCVWKSFNNDALALNGGGAFYESSDGLVNFENTGLSDPFDPIGVIMTPAAGSGPDPNGADEIRIIRCG